MRNSSLVKRFRAENLPGLSVVPNPRIRPSGRVVGERRRQGRRVTVRTPGPSASENAGVSSEEGWESPPPND